MNNKVPTYMYMVGTIVCYTVAVVMKGLLSMSVDDLDKVRLE